MVLQCAATTRSARHVGRGVLVTQRVVLTDPSGALVAEHLWSTLHVDATIDAELGSPAPDHAFPEGARAHPLGTRVVPVDRDQTFRYGGVSGDRIGHSMSDAIARAEGFPGKILQGMCTFGLAAGALLDLAAGGDADRVRRLAVRFARPAFPGRELEVHAFDAGPTATGDRAVAFEARQDGVVVLRHGRIELAP
jgi:acyl dehydratase